METSIGYRLDPKNSPKHKSIILSAIITLIMFCSIATVSIFSYRLNYHSQTWKVLGFAGIVPIFIYIACFVSCSHYTSIVCSKKTAKMIGKTFIATSVVTTMIASLITLSSLYIIDSLNPNQVVNVTETIDANILETKDYKITDYTKLLNLKAVKTSCDETKRCSYIGWHDADNIKIVNVFENEKEFPKNFDPNTVNIALIKEPHSIGNKCKIDSTDKEIYTGVNPSSIENINNLIVYKLPGPNSLSNVAFVTIIALVNLFLMWLISMYFVNSLGESWI